MKFFSVLCFFAVSYLAFDLDAEEEAFVKKILDQMTVEEKVGQMIECDCSVTKIADYKIGSVLHTCANNPKDMSLRYNELQQKALSTRLSIPVIWGHDAVHGVLAYNVTYFPHNINLGCANDTDLMYRIGKATAEEVVGSGQTWMFAPCLAVARDARWGRTYESYSEDPHTVGILGRAFLKGVQEPTRFDNLAVTTCVKHFAGDGGTAWGTGVTGLLDEGDTVCDEKTFRDIHLTPYVHTLKEDPLTVMISFTSWNGVKMHAHKQLVTDVLKTEMKFNGFVISDYEGCNKIPGADHIEKVTSCVNAGIDMVMTVENYESYIAALKSAIEQNKISMDRINDAVTRILRIKHRSGLFDHPYFNNTAAQASIASPQHRAIAREAAQKSAVLLKNEGSIIPVKKESNVLVTGFGARSLGCQLGGWSLSWQGSKDDDGKMAVGSTVLQGIQTALAGKGKVTYNEKAENIQGNFDVAIAVVAEYPYAEWYGDTKTLAITDDDKAMLANLAKANIPTIAITLSGRPVIITDHLPNWKAFIAAFLPGTEGGDALADLIFGDAKFSGHLSMTWPKSVDQEPINIGDATYDPLFAFRAGITN